MNVYLIDKRVFSIFDYGMFHGLAIRRDSVKSDKGEMYTEGEPLLYPLHLTRNVRHPAEIFMPNLSIVVSRRVKEAIEKAARVTFFPTICDEMFECDIDAKARAEFRKSRWKRDEDAYMREMARRQPVRSCKLEFFEVIPHDYDQAAIGLVGLQHIETFIGPADQRVRAKIDLSAELLAKAPVIYHLDGYHVLSSVVYEAMLPFLDRSFFLISEVRVRDVPQTV